MLCLFEIDQGSSRGWVLQGRSDTSEKSISEDDGGGSDRKEEDEQVCELW